MTDEALKKMKYCPLCQRKWKIIEEEGKKGKAYFVCFWCEISIWIRDPMIGTWETFEKVPCPHCKNQDMTFFCRSDQYCKWYCKHCHGSIETLDPEKHRKINMDTKPEDIITI